MAVTCPTFTPNAITTSSTSQIVSSPSDTQVGDLLVVTLNCRTTGLTFTPPSGWTAVDAGVSGNSYTRQSFWKVATTAGVVSFTFTSSAIAKGVHYVYRLVGAHATAPIGGFAGASGSGASAMTIGAITTPFASGALLITSGTLSVGTTVAGDPVVTGVTFGTTSKTNGTSTEPATWSAVGPISGTTTPSGTQTQTPSGTATWSSRAIAIAPAAGSSDTTAPSVPTGLAATPINATRVDLSWSASTDDTAVTGYRVYRDAVQIGTTAGTTYSDTTAAASTTYSYTVAAYDGAGNVSAQTSGVSATTPVADTTAPTAPSALTSTGSTATSVSLSWTASTDAVGVTGYRIYRNGTQVGTTTGATTFTDTTAAAVTTYAYTVKAVDAAGNLSAASNNLSVTTPAGSPAWSTGYPRVRVNGAWT